MSDPTNGDDDRTWAGLDGYERLTVVGRGGTATVYSATRTSDGEPVAIKLFDDPDHPAFHRQRRAAERLRHVTGVIAIDDHGTLADGRPYLVTPFAHGGSLGDQMQRFGPMAPQRVAELGGQLARSLGAAHDASVLHRDLKPSNMLLDASGDPLLADFGAATIVEPETASETMTVTIIYAAPEVLEGGAATERSDVYSLGLTLLALASGSHPFGMTDEPGLATLVNRICSTGAPDPTELGVPAGLAAVLRRATALDPDDRYRNCDELAAALTEVQGHLDTAPPEPPTAAATGDSRTATSTRRALLVGIALLVLLGALAAFALLRDDDPGDAAAEVPTTLTDPVTEANGMLGPLYQQDRWTYVGRMSEECAEGSTLAAMAVHADEDDRAAGVPTPWEAAAGEQAGVFQAYLPCEAGGDEVRFTLRGPGRWFPVLAEFTQDQYDRMVAWARENETSPAPDYTVDLDHIERLQDPENYQGWSIVDRAE